MDLVINMDETPMYFDMLPQRTLAKKGSKEVRVRSSGSEKKRLTVALTCTGSGKMLPALAIFKGKRKLKFSSPKNVEVQCKQKPGWIQILCSDGLEELYCLIQKEGKPF